MQTLRVSLLVLLLAIVSSERINSRKSTHPEILNVENRENDSKLLSVLSPGVREIGEGPVRRVSGIYGSAWTNACERNPALCGRRKYKYHRRRPSNRKKKIYSSWS